LSLLRLLAPRSHTPLHLLLAHILDVARQRPAVAERIGEGPRAIAVKLVGDRLLDFSARCHRAFERRVDVVEIDHQAAGGAAA
jgi:hypothetical protein